MISCSSYLRDGIEEKKAATMFVRTELLSMCDSFSFRHFTLSRQQIANPKYIISYPDVHHPHGLIGTSIGLNMKINSQYFEDGVLRIKCVASISPIIWSGNKETVIQQQGLQQFEIPLPSIDTREVLFLGEHVLPRL